MRISTKPSTSALVPSRLLLLPLALITLTSAQSDSKRGISVLSDLQAADWSLLTESAISWYWNWSPYPSNATLVSDLIFVPQIHGISDIAANVAQVKSLPSTSTHLMTFNEPDGSSDTGGTSISPKDAAEAYIKNILPLRKSHGGKFLISHPATTGSPQGLDWLGNFTQECNELNPSEGCPLDFITAHWYGDFAGLSSWVGQLDEYYNGNTSNYTGEALKIWVSELSLPKQSVDDTMAMLNQSLPFLDDSDVVGGYSWFGNFRTGDTNEFTGSNVALWDKHGGLTALGAEYLNAEGNSTFVKGQKGAGASAATALEMKWWLAASMCLGGLWLTSM